MPINLLLHCRITRAVTGFYPDGEDALYLSRDLAPYSKASARCSYLHGRPADSPVRNPQVVGEDVVALDDIQPAADAATPI